VPSQHSQSGRADLAGLFDDLPETGAPAMPERPRRRRRYPILTVALLVLITVAATHVVAAVTVPWLWVGFLVVILLFATIGHSRSSQDR
jgi:fatty acid desaturase